MTGITCRIIKNNIKEKVNTRLACMGIFSTGRVVLLADVGKWLELEIGDENIDKVRELAVKGRGSLTVTLDETGIGSILDKED